MPTRATASAGLDEPLVLGIGNPIMSDDGAGIAALLRLERDPRLPPGVRLVEGGTGGPELLGAVEGCRRLLVLDAADVGARPGQVVRLELEELLARPAPLGVHELGLLTLVHDLRVLGEWPEAAVLLGIQPGRIEPGTTLSPEVERGLDLLVSEAVQVLDGWLRAGTGPAGR